MEIPKPSFLRKSTLQEFILPKEISLQRHKPGRLASLKDLRKEHFEPMAFSYLSSISSSPKLTEVTGSMDVSLKQKAMKSKLNRVSLNLHQETRQKPGKKTIGGVIGTRISIPTTRRIVIQIETKLPQRFQLKKYLARQSKSP